MAVKDMIQQYEPQIMEWYRHLHQYPEPSFEEFETTAYLIQELGKLEHFTVRQLSKTGVIADIEGAKPGNRIAVRADIDALYTKEASAIEFPSLKPDLMHACGHDGHTTMLLAVAKYLNDHQGELEGSFRLLFQPAEELPPGGAIEYVKLGALEGVDYVLGQHVMSLLDTGTFGMTDGPIMAASDTVTIKLTGKEGHASQPHLNVDVITTGCQIVNALQALVAREVDALENVVLSITNFHSGTAHNIMPRHAELIGSIRTFNNEVRHYVAKRIEEIAKAIGTQTRCEVEVDYVFGYDPTINHPEVAHFVKGVLQRNFSDDAVMDVRPLMGAEDFSYYLNEVPGVYYFLGIKNEEKGFVHPIHHSAFQIDPPALLIGAEGLVVSALELAKLKK